MIVDLAEAARVLVPPAVILFDWHATLVDTREAMYRAVDEMLPRIPELGLAAHIVPRERARSEEDARLVEYVRVHFRLPPRIVRERRISRTDIFEILFGGDEDAKHLAHEAFNAAYRHHYGEVHPFDGEELKLLRELDELGVRTGILTNREREFFEREFALVEGGAWLGLFETTVCGGDTFRRKPNPEPILHALVELRMEPDADCWYLGDSSTDVSAAKRAGITSVLFNGAGWDLRWLERVFPGSAEHPHRPDAVVGSFVDFRWLVERCLAVRHQL